MGIGSRSHCLSGDWRISLKISSSVFDIVMYNCVSLTPLLKRQGLEISDPSSYRPISNLNTISKIIERLVLKRITSHVHVTSVDHLQSAYRRFYSTETALLKITDDIYEGFNAGQLTLLVALDCIDHNTLLGPL